MDLIKLAQGTYANYVALASKDQYTVYFCTDTHQIFVGAQEYTKGTKTISAEPTSATAGDAGRLYAYNGNLYLCVGEGETAGTYEWVRVANINDTEGTVTSITAEDGVETADGQAITATGTIKHSIPTGATTVVDPTADATPGFGSTFAIQGVATDKFGHVTASNTRTITLPTETPVTVAANADEAQALAFGGTFAAITGVAMDASDDHEIEKTATVFTLPVVPEAVTYDIASPAEGVMELTTSTGGSSTVAINGWDLLAKKADITTVFRYKGTVATVADLQNIVDPQVGDVYQVATGPQGTSCEYVCIDPTASPVTWEELGTTVDLSAYATTAYVDQKLAWQTF